MTLKLYLFKGILLGFLFVATVFGSLIWFVHLSAYLDFLFNAQHIFLAFLSTFFVLSIFYHFIAAFALLVGLLTFHIQLEKSSERTACHAIGISKFQLFNPAIVFVLFISLSVLLNNFFLKPIAEKSLYTLKNPSTFSTNMLRLQEDTFQLLNQNVRLRVGQQKHYETYSLFQDVMLEYRNALQLLISCQRGIVQFRENGQILFLMENGQIQYLNQQKQQIGSFHFQRHTMDISSFLTLPPPPVLVSFQSAPTLWKTNALSIPSLLKPQPHLIPAVTDLHNRFLQALFVLFIGLITILQCIRFRHLNRQTQNLFFALFKTAIEALGLVVAYNVLSVLIATPSMILPLYGVTIAYGAVLLLRLLLKNIHTIQRLP